MSGIKYYITKLPYIRSLLQQRKIRKKYKIELDLINGKPIQSSSKTSIIHFSIDKAATQYIKKILKRIAAENDLTVVGIHDYAFESKMPYLHELSFNEMERYKHIFRTKGFLYSVFGKMIMNIDQIGEYNVLLSIRDPRDVLVSYYFSMAYSHVLPPQGSSKRDNFMNRREKLQKLGIDNYVLSDCDRIFTIYKEYKDDLIEKYSNVGVIKYENMINHFETWLEDLIQICDMSISEPLKKEIITDFNTNKVRKEDKYKHMRKGISGDYKDKLSQETIRFINNKFSSILQFYEYDIH